MTFWKNLFLFNLASLKMVISSKENLTKFQWDLSTVKSGFNMSCRFYFYHFRTVWLHFANSTLSFHVKNQKKKNNKKVNKQTSKSSRSHPLYLLWNTSWVPPVLLIRRICLTAPPSITHGTLCEILLTIPAVYDFWKWDKNIFWKGEKDSEKVLFMQNI